MLSNEAKKAYQEENGSSKIMAQGVKIQSEDLVDHEVTIQDYDQISSDYVDDDGREHHHYFAVTFEELPGNYLLSGSALTKLIDWAEGQGEDVRGEKVRFGAKQKLKNGRTFVPVTLL